jgi:hypothetical protein
MNKEEFNKILKDVGLTKKNFAIKLGIKQQTVNSWGTTQQIPYWVESWLDNYGKAKLGESVIAAVSTLFGYHGPLYADNVAASLTKIFNLQKKENFNRFKKNIDDGYTAWFIYRFYYRQGSSPKLSMRLV